MKTTKRRSKKRSYHHVPFWLGLSLVIIGTLLLAAILIASHGSAVPLLAGIGYGLIHGLGIGGSLALSYLTLGAGLSSFVAEIISPGSVMRFFKDLADIITCGTFHERLYPTQRIVYDDNEYVMVPNSTSQVTSQLGGAGSRTQTIDTSSHQTIQKPAIKMTRDEYTQAFGEESAQALKGQVNLVAK